MQIRAARAARRRPVAVSIAMTVLMAACSSPRSPGVPVGSDVTLLYGGPGVELVAATTVPESAPSHLFLSDDGLHWRDVTPPQSRTPVQGGARLVFQQASFLNPTNGWVVACAEAVDVQTAYQTSDGGAHSRSVQGPGCNDHGSSTVQDVSPTLAITDNKACPGITCTVLSTLGRGGTSSTEIAMLGEQHEMVVYGTDIADPLHLWPVRNPIQFVTDNLAFADAGLGPPEGAFGYIAPPGYFVRSTDGGRTWTQVSAPVPGGDRADQVSFDLPDFSTPNHRARCNARPLPSRRPDRLRYDQSSRPIMDSRRPAARRSTRHLQRRLSHLFVRQPHRLVGRQPHPARRNLDHNQLGPDLGDRQSVGTPGPTRPDRGNRYKQRLGVRLASGCRFQDLD